MICSSKKFVIEGIDEFYNPARGTKIKNYFEVMICPIWEFLIQGKNQFDGHPEYNDGTTIKNDFVLIIYLRRKF